MWASLKVFREAFITLSIGVVGSLGAGIILGGMHETLNVIPGLILLLPGALGARGTIHGALGSKLSSTLHLGLIEMPSWRNNLVQKNAGEAHKATLYTSFFLGFIASGLAIVLHINANPFLLFFISLASGALSGIILIVFTNIIVFQAFRRGWDPDNVTAPLIATVGDFITVPILFGSAFVGVHLPQDLLIFIFIIATLYILWEVRGYIIKPRFLILSGSVTIQTFAAIFLQRQLNVSSILPGFFVYLPAFLAQGGNLASFIASRLSTQLHLGTLAPQFTPKRNVINEMIRVAFLSLLIFPLLAVGASLVHYVSGIPHLPFLEVLRVVLIAGFLNTLLVAIFFGFLVSILSWRLRLNPDDVTIPFLSSIADFFGIVFLFMVYPTVLL